MSPVAAAVYGRRFGGARYKIVSGQLMDSNKPMFLPNVENSPQPSPYAEGIRAIQASGGEYPKIWHLLAYRPQAADHLAAFTQEIMRGECPLSPGIRELIAAFTSAANHCPF